MTREIILPVIISTSVL